MSDVEYRSGYSKSSSISPSRIRSRSPSDHKSSSRSPSHSKTRSRSLSRPPSRNGIKYKSGSRHSYSRSRSYSGDRQPSYRSHSQGSGSRHSRHENPKPNKCLGIFGLSVYTTEPKLYDVFIKYGSIEKILIIMDAKTGRSRGFGFAYFKKHEDAKVAKEECSGMEIDGRKIRVDFSLTQRPHKPTPGIYMGRPTMREERSFRTGYNRYDNSRYDRDDRYDRGERYDRYDTDRDNDDHYDGGYRGGGGGGGGGHYREHRSPSHYKNRSRYDRSRSRSYSTCRYQ